MLGKMLIRQSRLFYSGGLSHSKAAHMLDRIDLEHIIRHLLYPKGVRGHSERRVTKPTDEMLAARLARFVAQYPHDAILSSTLHATIGATCPDDHAQARRFMEGHGWEWKHVPLASPAYRALNEQPQYRQRGYVRVRG
jgi:hypothetical protein